MSEWLHIFPTSIVFVFSFFPSFFLSFTLPMNLHNYDTTEFQKDKNVRDPNLGLKMSEFYISIDNPQIRLIFLMINDFKALIHSIMFSNHLITFYFRQTLSL